MTGKSIYDVDSKYTIKKMGIQVDKSQGFELKDIAMESSGTMKDNLVGVSASSNIKSLNFTNEQGDYLLDNITYNFSLDGLSAKALDKMRNLDSNDQEAAKEAFKQLFAKSITFKIDELSLKKATQKSSGDTIDGFTMNSVLKLDKIDNFAQIESNPMAILNLLDATAHIEFSDSLFAMIQKDPQAGMFLASFAPLDENGNKVYNLTYKNGVPTVNGKPLR
jgi:hypothetical protein